MREKRPAYNLISNNCQNFAVNMLDAIQVGAHREFATTFVIYSRATGKGSIKDLFAERPAEAQTPAQSHETHDATMQYAQQVMEQNTTKIDDHPYHGHHVARGYPSVQDYPPAQNYPPQQSPYGQQYGQEGYPPSGYGQQSYPPPPQSRGQQGQQDYPPTPTYGNTNYPPHPTY